MTRLLLASTPHHTAPSLTRLIVAGVALAGILSCTSSAIEVGGERSQFGDCPEDECSDAAPAGLTFVGTGFWDDEIPRLGPVMVKGDFDLGIRRTDDGSLPAFDVEVVGSSPGLQVTPGVGDFTQSGWPLRDVDGFVTLRGLAPGPATLRVIERDTGLLLDLITIEVDKVSEIVVLDVDRQQSERLFAGENVLIGVRLISSNSGQQMRIIDQSVQLTVDGDVQPENMYWDCFTYDVPMDRDTVTFTATTGDMSQEVTFDIVR